MRSPALDRAESVLPIGRSIQFYNSHVGEGHSLFYVLPAIDALPVYSFVNAKGESLAFDRNTIPYFLEDIGIGSGQEGDFPYDSQSRAIREINNPQKDSRLLPFSLSREELLGENVGNVASFILRSDLRVEKSKGVTFLGREYWISDSHEDAVETKHFAHGTPELVWNDPSLSRYTTCRHHTLEKEHISEKEQGAYTSLSFGWILRLVGSHDMIGFARWDDAEGIEKLVEAMSDTEALHVEQILMDAEYFENKK